MIHTRRLGQNMIRIQRIARSTVMIASPRAKTIPAYQLISSRHFSDTNRSNENPDPSTITEQFSSTIDSIQGAIDDKVLDAAVAVTQIEPPGFVVGNVMEGLDWIHNFVGVPYWEAIILATIGIRLAILPVAIKTVQGAARMALLRPDLEKIQKEMVKEENANSPHMKLRFEQEVRELFIKHKVNPLRAVLWPFVQFPLFIAFFLALKDMGLHYPGFATGGTLWFENLAIADPYYALPLINAASFLIMIEIGQDGVQMEQQQKFKTVMRFLAVAMVPLTITMPQGLFVYWGTNNVISIIQTRVLKQPGVRKFFDIPDMPKPENTPFLKPQSPIEAIRNLIEKERSRTLNAKAEIIDGKETKATNDPIPPPPPTFSAPPRKKEKSKKPAPRPLTLDPEKKK